MTESSADFCIAGGGPAGLTLALLLLRSGARVTVAERSRTLDRAFRGDILQPGGMRLLHELGVLDSARERGCHEHDGFLLTDRGRVLLRSDYRRLPGPFNCLLSLPQRHLLEALLDACGRHAGFRYLPGSRVTGLIRDGGQAWFAVSDGSGESGLVRAHCLIAADGRYSKVRQLAGIADGRSDQFGQDIVWFRLPAAGCLPREVQVFRENGSPAISYASVPDGIQCGWTIPHGAYRQLAAGGIGPIRQQLQEAMPPYARAIGSEITSPRDVTLLDVFSGCAGTWVQDRLVLIGDSAHTQSPIGAQGINLAIQDAVVLHPLLMASLSSGDASAAFLGRFAELRRPDIDRVMKIQVLQSKVMFSANGIAARLRPAAAKIVARSPLYRRVLSQLAFGNKRIAIESGLLNASR